MPAVLWFRRDLRLADHPALCAAAAQGEVLALYVLDEALLKPSGKPRLAFMYGCLEALDEQLGGRLQIVKGDPKAEVLKAAQSVGATEVHVSTDCAPYGRKRDAEVAKALAEHGIDWVETGSPYAITPGRITKADGDPYKVYTPFYRAWVRHSWPNPAKKTKVDWIEPKKSLKISKAPSVGKMVLPEPGEKAALKLWRAFLDSGVNYADGRDRPDLPGTTKISPYLRWGCVHPRTLLKDLEDETLRGEIAWRDFHADVLWHNPKAARWNLDKRFDSMRHEDDKAAFELWCQGKTGFPIVDAGMRQLLAEGWMHNRVRMIVASFLVKDLHLPWQWGARHFMRHLVDGDLASNQLNWQWVAGSGSDAAPYFRVFNPTTQGKKFDPNGDYGRRYIPENENYPAPMVDHAHERQVALERYGEITGS
ncbi:deoxyribodipyrimidine photo-lyase [Amycolatopsis sp. cg5]|uniref:cryptochrome/photolyase family protein n=1 Tax=Amycolatopsis sp. cg5 TaxID=3238802 RepID=UPI0035231872